jgi:hypothetical protein
MRLELDHRVRPDDFRFLLRDSGGAVGEAAAFQRTSVRP